MKAFILAAGLGTRLRPWTLEHPKALVPVGGVAMLERVITRLRDEGFDDIVVNVHHFAEQIVDFIGGRDFGVRIRISDESSKLLDTGGAILHAASFLDKDPAPFLVHNVDILSDAPLSEIMKQHLASGRDISLVTSPRDSLRRLVFDSKHLLRGWHNLSSGLFRPAKFKMESDFEERAFSGIYVVNPSVLSDLRNFATEISDDKFPVMAYLLSRVDNNNIGEIELGNLNLIDIGKPETLSRADTLYGVNLL